MVCGNFQKSGNRAVLCWEFKYELLLLGQHVDSSLTMRGKETCTVYPLHPNEQLHEELFGRKCDFWDPLKIHLFPITLNSENFSFAKKITMAFRTFISGTIWFISAICYEGSENHGFNMFPCIFSLARVVSDFAIPERPVSLCSFTSVPGEPEGSGFGPVHRQGSPGTLSLLKSHWPLLTDWESELRFLSAQFRGTDFQKPQGYFNLHSPCLFLPPP